MPNDNVAVAMVDNLALLKRKRMTVRSNITRFCTKLNEYNEDCSFECVEYECNRLTNLLKEMKLLDNDIHQLLSDQDYDSDVITCEEYVDNASLTLYKAQKLMEKNTSNSLSSNFASNSTPMTTSSTSPPESHTCTIKLPTVKLESFRGNIEYFQSFWEQFKSSIDENPNLSTVDKHVYLRAYLDDEPKRLVDGISIVGETYEMTKEILVKRYGNINKIIQAHLDFLENLTPIRNPTPTAMNNIFIECNRRLQALAALGENINAYGRILVPKILRVFPEDICRRWVIYAKREEFKEDDITNLQKFLSEEVEGALTALKIRGNLETEYHIMPSMSALQVHSKHNSNSTSTKKPSPFCPFCDTAGHWPQDCKTVTDIDARITKLKATGRCFLCTNRGHNQKNCPRKEKAFCYKCKKKHHSSICKGIQNAQVPPSSDTNQVDTFSTNYTHLQTARIVITGPKGKTKTTRCILDGGSQASFIHTSLIDELQLKVIDSQSLQVRAFETSSNSAQPRRKVQFKISSAWDSSNVHINAFESSNTYTPHPTAPKDIAASRRIQLADPCVDDSDLPIEVLIGGDFYWSVVTTEVPIKLSENLVLVPSILGWIVSGSRAYTSTTSIPISVTHNISLDMEPKLNEFVRQFWDLDTLGIKNTQEKELSSSNLEVLKEFQDSYKLEDGRRVVKLPWKQDVSLSSDNYGVAIKRLNVLQKRFSTNPDFKSKYVSLMQDYIEKNQVEITDCSNNNSRVYYLPHHAVKKQKQNETKWRIVFDASSSTTGSISLNDALNCGPNLLPEILAVLLRFRLHKQVIISDGSQAFLQLVLSEEDRDATRFLWFKTEKDEKGNIDVFGDICTYRFSRLTFGLTSSPFLLSATIQELADKHASTFPTASKLLKKNTFMDDFIMGVEKDDEALKLYYEMQELMSLIKMPLAKWNTNCQLVKDVWKHEKIEFKTEAQVLGVDWNTEKDVLHHDFSKIVQSEAKEPATKRFLLRTLSKFYDPLGLFAPVLVVAKILFQDTWLSSIGWDELLSPIIALNWNKWITELPALNQIHISRWIGIHPNTDATVHIFCDASERAYGAVLYVRLIKDGKVDVKPVCSRNRLSPVKKVTLPRLELLAALLGSRLLRYVCDEMGLERQKAILWSDSFVTLHWIRGDPNRWKTFVCNRTTEILQHTNPSQWRYCPSAENPADSLSRGISPKELCKMELWWNGPRWLIESNESWPAVSFPESNRTAESETRKPKLQNLCSATVEPLIDISRFSSYIKLIRVTAWIFRFVKNCRSQHAIKSDLTAEEFENARNYLINTAQKESFPEEFEALKNSQPLPKGSKIARYNPFLQNNLMRLGGRLQFSELTLAEKHPLIMHGSHPFVQLLIHYTHIKVHHLGVRIVLSELRSYFWIIQGRAAIKKMIHKCLPCRLSKAQCSSQIEAPLPKDRVTRCEPFATTGVDFAGPVFVKNEKPTNTAYIALFTCSTTRAIHIELVSDMTTDRFLMALQRFASRRGLPQTIYTDNARNFQAANGELTFLWNTLTSTKAQQYYAQNGIKWKFIVPRAAWWGGWWERLIGVIKSCLRKSIGKAFLDEESLITVLTGIEAAINSRPLTSEEGNENVVEALSPAHFLIGRKLTTIPSAPESKNVNLTKAFKRQQEILDGFWKRWTKEYLLQLRSYHQVRNIDKHSNVRIGDIVLLQEDVRPRHVWRKALVLELIKGRDGKIRSCVLRMNGKKILRPVQLIIPLEADQGGEDVAV